MTGGNIMRTLAAILSVFFIVMLSAGFTQSAQEKSAEKKAGVPIIEVQTPTYDFAEVTQGEVVTHEFQVFNRGSAPLEIKGVKPD